MSLSPTRGSALAVQSLLGLLSLPLSLPLAYLLSLSLSLKINHKFLKNEMDQGTWVAQLVEHPTLDLSSGLSLSVMSSSPMLGFVLGMKPT